MDPIRAASKAAVLELRFFKSCKTRAGIPPTGRDVKPAFLATISERVLMMMGSRVWTSDRIVWASLSAMGLGTA